MKKGRLEAFTDGVVAIIITIMVLELHVPHTDHISDLLELWPVFFSYLLSFVYVGLYWNNHHHLFYTIEKINGAILWANLNFLFWLSLLPFVTSYIGENHFSKWPIILYGLILIMNGLSFNLIASALIRQEGKDCALAKAYGKNLKGKLSIMVYAVAIIISFFCSWVGFFTYLIVAAIWFVPDRRIEKAVVD